ncbi:MAG TPA: pitrilysin family protein [Cryomorphaceae bacterium]|nr:pitrilysin family protein [Cryomorphaceae bacterium]
MDRTIAPRIEKVRELSIPSQKPFDHIHGAPVFVVEDETEELTKIELVFPAGTGEESLPLLATSTSSMLTEGAGDFSSHEISEIKDFYGAKIQAGVGKDMASITLVCLKAHLIHMVPLLTAVIQSPNFPEKEFESYKRRTKAQLKVNLERVEIICRLAFSKQFFGESKYAERYSPDDFDKIGLDDLKAFHAEKYRLNVAKIFISGASVSEALLLLKQNLKANNSLVHTQPIGDFNPARKTNFVKKEGALQSAIRVGFPGISRHHEDYPAFYIANTILGGYFGSRLMQNIREEKGYTYGIGSSINQLKDLAYVVISTQVGTEHTSPTLKEILHEVNQLRMEAVTTEEMDLVKNYTAGSLLRNFDGTFNRASLLKTMLIHELPESYYPEFLKKIYTVSAEDILKVAQKYFDPDKFTVAIVGDSFTDND